MTKSFKVLHGCLSKMYPYWDNKKQTWKMNKGYLICVKCIPKSSWNKYQLFILNDALKQKNNLVNKILENKSDWGAILILGAKKEI